MSNHPNRNWRRRWTIDLEKGTATHDSGFAVAYDESGAGVIVGGAPTLPDEAESARNEAQKLARLLREAGEIYREKIE